MAVEPPGAARSRSECRLPGTVSGETGIPKPSVWLGMPPDPRQSLGRFGYAAPARPSRAGWMAQTTTSRAAAGLAGDRLSCRVTLPAKSVLKPRSALVIWKAFTVGLFHELEAFLNFSGKCTAFMVWTHFLCISRHTLRQTRHPDTVALGRRHPQSLDDAASETGWIAATIRGNEVLSGLVLAGAAAGVRVSPNDTAWIQTGLPAAPDRSDAPHDQA